MSKTVIEMAKEAGFPFNKFGLLQGDDNGEIDADQMLERLVELARADEREACAKVCDSRGLKFFSESPFAVECHGLAAAIRAKGNT